MNCVAENVYGFIVHHYGLDHEIVARIYRNLFGREIDDGDYDSGMKELLVKLSESGETEEQVLISLNPDDADNVVNEWKKVVAESAIEVQQHNQWVDWVNATNAEEFSKRNV